MQLTRYIFIMLIAIGISSCSNDETPTNTPDPTDPGIVIWDGPDFVFTKTDGSDPDNAINQDRISDNVWITRGNNGGQIYNAATESDANKNSSPAGTEWALGTTAELGSLNFQAFRATVGDPKNVVGKDLVLHLIEDNIYLDVRFTQWSQGRLGGFEYRRSTGQ